MHCYEFISPVDLTNRNATIFNHEVSILESNIWIRMEDRQCNAKSLLGILSMCIRKNSKLTIEIDGDNCQNVFDKIKDILNNMV